MPESFIPFPIMGLYIYPSCPPICTETMVRLILIIKLNNLSKINSTLIVQMLWRMGTELLLIFVKDASISGSDLLAYQAVICYQIRGWYAVHLWSASILRCFQKSLVRSSDQSQCAVALLYPIFMLSDQKIWPESFSRGLFWTVWSEFLTRFSWR